MSDAKPTICLSPVSLVHSLTQELAPFFYRYSACSMWVCEASVRLLISGHPGWACNLWRYVCLKLRMSLLFSVLRCRSFVTYKSCALCKCMLAAPRHSSISQSRENSFELSQVNPPGFTGFTTDNGDLGFAEQLPSNDGVPNATFDLLTLRRCSGASVPHPRSTR